MAATSLAVEDDPPGTLSPSLQAFLEQPAEVQQRAIKALPPRERVRLLHDWHFWGRTDQVWRPGPEIHTFYLAGRGWGKTRVGAEAIRYVARNPHLAGARRRLGPSDRNYGTGAVIGIAGRTANDVNETMLYGPSGLMTITPEHERPRHVPSRKLLVWPNGCVARLMSGDVPESFRGPNFGVVWTDELAHWAKLARSLTQLRLAHRHGKRIYGIHTTTPLGVMPLLKMIFQMDKSGAPRPAREGERSLQGYALRDRVRIVRGSTYDNADNLSPDFLEETVGDFEGTEEGDQELRAVILFGSKGAPWQRDWIEHADPDAVPELVHVAVAIDPTGSDGEETKDGEACECGIVVLGLDIEGTVWVLDDVSGVMTPPEWAEAAVRAGIHWDADEFLIEENYGGALLEGNLRQASPRSRIRIRRLHATKSKFKRATLVAHLWKHGKVKHANLRGFVRLEYQMCHFDPNKPERDQLSDRMDALVWGMLGLVGDGTDRKRLRGLSRPEVWRKIRDELNSRKR